MSTFPDGLYQYGGQPVGSSVFTSPWADAYFVDGTDGNDNNSGLRPTEAKKTVQAAVTAAGSQDIIYVRPLAPLTDPSDIGRYAEHVTVPYTSHNLSLIGVTPHYDPYYGPKLAGTNATGYTLDVRAPGFHMENILLHRRDSDTGGLRLTGQPSWATYLGSLGASIVHCILKGGPHYVIGGFNSIFYRCTWCDAPYGLTFDYTGSDAAGNVAGRGHRVIDCDFLSGDGGGTTTTAYIRWMGAHYNFIVKNCYFEQVCADGHFIHVEGANEGMIADCKFGDGATAVQVGSNDTTDELYVDALTGAKLSIVNCYDGLSFIVNS